MPPVGRHTCQTVGEQGEPKEVDDKRINVSISIGEPTALGYVVTLLYPVVVGAPTGTDREIRLPPNQTPPPKPRPYYPRQENFWIIL